MAKIDSHDIAFSVVILLLIASAAWFGVHMTRKEAPYHQLRANLAYAECRRSGLSTLDALTRLSSQHQVWRLTEAARVYGDYQP